MNAYFALIYCTELLFKVIFFIYICYVIILNFTLNFYLISMYSSVQKYYDDMF